MSEAGRVVLASSLLITVLMGLPSPDSQSTVITSVEEKPAQGVISTFAVEDLHPGDQLLNSMHVAAPDDSSSADKTESNHQDEPTSSWHPDHVARVAIYRRCPHDCSGHGLCNNGTCTCHEGFSESDCSLQLCEADCSAHGLCLNGHCSCDEGWTGANCSAVKPVVKLKSQHPTAPSTDTVVELLQNNPESTRLNTTRIWPNEQTELHGVSARHRWGHSAHSFTETMLIFGGTTGEKLLNDLWSFSVIEGEWSPVPVVGYSPAPRLSHGGAASDAELLIFGGTDAEGSVLSDGWRFNLDSRAWTLQASPPHRAPLARHSHVLTSWPLHNMAVLYGGRGHDLQSFGDSWLFDFAAPHDKSWRLLNSGRFNDSSGVPLPSARYAPSGVVKGGSLVMFGGRDSVGVLYKDLWELDLESGTWTERKPQKARHQGEWPGPRCQHTAVVRADMMWLFGGEDANLERLEELWSFSFSAHKWQLVHAADTRPSARISHSAVIVQQSMLVYGGHNDVLAADLWSYNLVDQWTSVNERGWTMSPRAGHAMGVVGSAVLVFGGEEEDGNIPNDLWRFEVKPATWSCLSRNGDPNAPEGRSGHSLEVLGDDGSGDANLMLFGGHALKGGQVLADLWRWAVKDKKWILVDPPKMAPQERTGHASLSLGHSFLVFGGQDISGGLLNDMWEYTQTQGWNQLAASQPASNIHAPTGRHHPILMPAWHHGKPQHGVLMFGGSIHHADEMQQVWHWDLGYSRWRLWKLRDENHEHKEHKEPHALLSSPLPRYCPAGIGHRNQMLIWGGFGDSELWNDYWLCDIDEKTWSKAQVNTPAPAARREMAAVKFGTNLLFHGGRDVHGVMLGDMWAIGSL